MGGAILTRWGRPIPGFRLLNTYGVTEVCVYQTVCEVQLPAEGSRAPLRWDNAGRGFESVQVLILDDNLASAPQGEEWGLLSL